MCGTECWEASSTRISGLGKAHASALLPHSMRKSRRGRGISCRAFLFVTSCFKVTMGFWKLQRNVRGSAVRPSPMVLYSFHFTCVPCTDSARRAILRQCPWLTRFPLVTHMHWVCSSVLSCPVCHSRDPPPTHTVRYRPMQHTSLPHATPCPVATDWLCGFILRMLYKWNQTECELLRLTSFIQRNFFGVVHVGIA